MTEVIFRHVKVKLHGRFDVYPIFKIHLPNALVLEYAIDREGNLITHVAQIYGYMTCGQKSSGLKLIAVYNKLVTAEFLEKFNRIINGDEE